MRHSGFELLRIIAMLLISAMHVASMGKSIEFGSFNYYAVGFISSIGNIGVSCFVLISGFFGVKSKADKIIHLVYLTTLYQVIGYLATDTVPGVHGGLGGFLQAVFIVPLYNNWYISCYIILMLISPYIETFVTALTKKDFEKFLLVLFICFSVLPTAFNSANYTILTAGGKCLTYFIFLYLIGRYLKIHGIQFISRKKLVLVFLCSTVIINLLNITAAKLLNRPVNLYAMDCSPFVLLSSLAVFYLFKSFTFHSTIINWISSSILAVYLLDGSRLFWDNRFFEIDNYASNSSFIFILILEVAFLFVVSILIDKVRNALFSGVEEKGIDFLLGKIRNLISGIYFKRAQ